jgi:ribulose 1,5-bisphosphate synthetase/thiazole synthase
VLAETEVLVVGGGPAGLAAAIAARRAGAETLLLERYGFYGGVITQAIMGSITWWRYAQTVSAGGICSEIEARAKEMGGSINLLEAVSDPSMKNLLYETAEKSGLLVDGKPTYEILKSEMFKIVADALVLDAGVTPMLHCQAVGAVMNGDSIEGVVTESKSGRQVIRAKRVIDATGDADVAAFCGAPFSKAAKGNLMEVTTNFSVCGVNLVDYMIYTVLQGRTMADWVSEDCGKERDMFSTHIFQVFRDAVNAGEIPPGVVIKAYPGGFTSRGDVLSLNAVHFWDVDPTDVKDLTRAEMEGRRRIVMAVDVLRKRVPGFEKAELMMIGASLGCRESRKITGEYLITEQDVRNQARFEDSVGIFPEFIDGYGVLCLPTTGRYFQVPYRITVPQKVENLLVAGRCVSGDRISHGAVRQMGCCMVTGQGAGVAAALSLKAGCTPRKVDVAKVQGELANQGVRLN